MSKSLTQEVIARYNSDGEFVTLMNLEGVDIPPASNVASFATDSSGNVTGLVGPGGAVLSFLKDQNAGDQYPGFLNPAKWILYGTGSGTVGATTDSTHGEVLRIAATTPGAKYGIGRDMTLGRRSPAAFSFMVKRDANLSVLDIEVGFEQYGFTKYRKLNKAITYLDAGAWVRVLFSLGEYEAEAGITAEALQDIRCIRFSITPTGGNLTTLDVADFLVHDAQVGGCVSFFFDDGRIDTYTEAYRIMRRFNMPGAVAVEYQAVGAGNRCSQNQLDEMYASGWDMCGHHTSSFPAMSPDVQVTTHKAIRSYLAAHRFTRGDHIFVYPGGARDANSDEIALGHWQYARQVSSFTQLATATITVDRVKLPHVYVVKTMTLAQAKAKIDKVKFAGGSVVFVFHSLVNSLVASEDWLISDFEALISYVHDQAVPVVPVSSIWLKQ